MYKFSATELNKHSGQILQLAQRSPVIIEKTSQPAAVVISYEYFSELEDYFFGSTAKEIEEHGAFLNSQESEEFLNDV